MSELRRTFAHNAVQELRGERERLATATDLGHFIAKKILPDKRGISSGRTSRQNMSFAGEVSNLPTRGSKRLTLMCKIFSCTSAFFASQKHSVMLRCTQESTETLSAAQKSTGSVRNAQGSSQARGESQNAQGRSRAVQHRSVQVTQILGRVC